MTWALYAHSHWQGAGPDTVVATGSRAACERAEQKLSTCSFCSPGQTAQHQVGECYLARRAKYVPRDTPALPEGSADWDRADFAAWLGDRE